MQAQGSASSTQPPPGKRYLAVRLRIKNVGNVVYDNVPVNGAEVVDAQHQEYYSAGLDAVEPALASVRLRPGESKVGWMTFAVPKRSTIRTFQFTTEGGFGPETGKWLLFGAR